MQLRSLIHGLIEILPPLTPIILAFIGWRLTARFAMIQTEVARKSGFQEKWAGLFFDACNEFMRAVERIMGLLHVYVSTQNKDDDEGKLMVQEINRLMNDLPEMTFRIKRLAALAKAKGKIASDIADEIFESIATGTNTKVMPTGQIRERIGKFNTATREAHGEILNAQNLE
jgi:hypothetical protein